MYTLKALALAFLALDAISVSHASVYVIQPSQGSTCHGGQPCTIQWLDDGRSPLLSDIGVCTVGLYTGNQQLVQSIEPVDVNESQSISFTPIPAAGPDSSDYYIALTSTSLSANGTSYTSFSPFFRLDQMSGSFASPLASAISSIPIPSSLTASASSSDESVLPTITVGTLDTSLPPISTLSATSPSSLSTSTSSSTSSSATSRFSTSVSPSSTSHLASSTTAPASQSNNSISRRSGSIPLPILGVLSLISFLSFVL